MQLIIEKDQRYHGTLIDNWEAFGIDAYTIEKWTYQCPKIVQCIDTEERKR